MKPGYPLIVAGSSGRAATYRVPSLEYIAKVDRLPASLFTQTGAARLVIVSCGGSFDRTTDEYADNVVVIAVPA